MPSLPAGRQGAPRTYVKRHATGKFKKETNLRAKQAVKAGKVVFFLKNQEKIHNMLYLTLDKKDWME